MQSVLSHIVQKRFSQVNEDVATDALAFILTSDRAARQSMIKLLRGLLPDLPPLEFRSQQAEGSIRPDLWGIHHSVPHVFIENKFWAGLTDNQPLSYLKQLSSYSHPTALLVVAPEARQHTLWRELLRRLAAENVGWSLSAVPSGVISAVKTELGPLMALTSWARVLSTLEQEVADDPHVRSDLLQLRALCESADSVAFSPMVAAEITNQRIPLLIQQLATVVQEAVELAVSRHVLSLDGLRPQSDWTRMGRYGSLTGPRGVGGWFGVHFGLWQTHGGTPLWLVFSDSSFGRATEVQSLLDPWASREGVFVTRHNGDYAVAIDVVTGEEKDRVVEAVVDRLSDIKEALTPLHVGKAGGD